MSDHRIWFVQKDNQNLGPFAFAEIIWGMQEKTIFGFDYLWKEGMDKWMRIFEIPEFHVDRIRDLQLRAHEESPSQEGSTEQGQGGRVQFISRNHRRFNVRGEVLVHDHQNVWLSTVKMGSAGGAGIVIPNSTLIPGSQLQLHFASHAGGPSFFVRGEIVNKQFCKDLKDSRSPVLYGLSFLDVNDELRKKIEAHFSGYQLEKKTA